MSDPHPALVFASDRHGGQMYGEMQYTTGHLVFVAVMVKHAGYPEMEAAAWLHDVVEDTKTTIEEIRALFGDETADLV